MRFLVLAVTGVMAAALLWAGLEKVRSPGSFAAVLRELGIPKRVAPAAALLAIGLEVSVALGLIFAPSTMTLLAVAGLAAAFALSGLVAIRQKKPIRCGCFGPYGGKQLGRSQLVTFPLWLAGLAVLWFGGAAVPDASRATWLLIGLALTMATIRAISAVRAAAAGRADRQSAREMFIWLSR